ncbi:MAG: serine hydrolase domain-containing protein, partial [Ginsengibacter sp.]
MNKFLLPLQKAFLLTLLIFPVVLHAQVMQETGKNNAVDYERLNKIDGLVNDYIKNDWVKGVVTIIVKDNQIVQYKGYGYADAAAKTKMQNDELFRIASQTKAFTAVGIM